MRRLALSLLPALLLLTPGCAGKMRYGAVEDGLALDTVVLYRNGVGYFERRGEVDDQVLTIKVRKDQVDDLLKSLTVVDANGQALSVSMPLDPQTWANAALATLSPGRGNLPSVLDALRGTEVAVQTVGGGRVVGRIVMVERILNEPDPTVTASSRLASAVQQQESRDHKLTLLDGDKLQVVRLSKVRAISFKDGDLAMQLHRSLDASAGEGMFEQVEVQLRLTEAKKHDVMVSYVVEAPMWKPTYRVVLPESGKGQALLQAWAVVDNTSGEDWSQVSMSLTSGAPISFRYDLHTPRRVGRADLTEAGVHKQARVSLGETSYGEPEPEPSPPPAPAEEMYEEEERAEYDFSDDEAGGWADSKSAAKPKREAKKKDKGGLGMSGTGRGGGGYGGGSRGIGTIGGAPGGGEAAAQGPSMDYDSLKRSTAASARAQQVSGLTRIDLTERVTVPDGSSTMVALINEEVAAEETFLFKPGGGGYGYESNPYRVVRFKNTSPYVLEPGPITIYSGGSFVGEGLSEAVGTDTSVTIPFAVESSILVNSATQYSGQEMKLLRIVRGVLEVENFYQTTTTWDVRLDKKADKDTTVLVRHGRQGPSYQLVNRPDGTEDLDGAYLVPVTVKTGANMATVKLVEQTPSRTTITIWDGQALDLLDQLLKMPDLDAEGRRKLQPIVDLRREIGKIDTQIAGKKKQQVELDKRAEETRRNLEAIKKDPKATKLRGELNKRLDEFTKEADKLGREIVELNSKRLEKKIALEDLLQDFDLKAPYQPGKGKSAPAKTPAK